MLTRLFQRNTGHPRLWIIWLFSIRPGNLFSIVESNCFLFLDRRSKVLSGHLVLSHPPIFYLYNSIHTHVGENFVVVILIQDSHHIFESLDPCDSVITIGLIYQSF